MEQNQMSTDSAASLVVPRRTLRKGTHSCAECKRRKTRCFFESAGANKCVGCKRRGLPCISQEFVDVPTFDARDDKDANLAESLERVQQMLKQIMKKTAPEDGSNSSLSMEASTEGLSAPYASSMDSQKQVREIQQEISLLKEQRKINSNDSNDSNGSGSRDRAARRSGPSTVQLIAPAGAADAAASALRPPPPGPPLPPTPSLHPPSLSETSAVLYAALPSQHDVNVLFRAGRIAIYTQALCNPYGQLFDRGQAHSLESMAALPLPSAHPTVLARKLLHLALGIQQLDPAFDASSLQAMQGPDDGGGMTMHALMERFFGLATGLVTCHDELLDSAEGLECLVCEGVYLVNAGNLRRALMTLRRALTLAQLMGVHKAGRPGCHPGEMATRTPAQRRIWRQHEPATQISGEATWVHLAYLERFIALHLGIPTSVTGVRFGTPERLPDESAAEWIEKLQLDICEFIMQRNFDGSGDSESDYAATRRIDQELNRIVDSMPPAWWAPLDFSGESLDTADLMERIINAQIQIVHFSLITLLHLPYLLRKPSSQSYSYSKAACTFASREILRRFIAFRAVVRVVFCCRPIDFCALSASLVLMIAHLSGQRSASSAGSGSADSSGWLLPHHRLGDRDLVQKTVQTMAELNRFNNGDELSRESASLVKRLLDLEAGAARQHGPSYQSSIAPDDTASLSPPASSSTSPASASASSAENAGAAGGPPAGPDPLASSPENDEQALLLNIPYFGAVKLTREAEYPTSEPTGWPTSSGSGAGGGGAASISSHISDLSGVSGLTGLPGGPFSTPSHSAIGGFSYLSSPLPPPGYGQPQQPPHLSVGSLSDPYLQVPGPHSTADYSPASFSHLYTTDPEPQPFLYYHPTYLPAEMNMEHDNNPGHGHSQTHSQSPEYYDIPMPDLMAGIDDWAFQGVDATFFDSIIRGANFSFPPP